MLDLKKNSVEIAKENHYAEISLQKDPKMSKKGEEPSINRNQANFMESSVSDI